MKITTPPEKCHPLFPINPSQKVECLSIPTLFEHLVGGSTPLPPFRKDGMEVHTMHIRFSFEASSYELSYQSFQSKY